MKRVSQYSVDIAFEEYVDEDIEELIAETLEGFGIDVLGVTFSDDMTEEYKNAGWLD